MDEWVKVEHNEYGHPAPETLPPDEALVQYLRRPRADFEIRLAGRVRRVQVPLPGFPIQTDDGWTGHFESAEMVPTAGPGGVIGEPFDGEPAGVGDYWRLIDG